MTSEEDKTREALDELETQLDDLRRRDPQMTARLEATIQQAKDALAEGSLHPHEHRSLVVQLTGAVRDYEAVHPKLAGNLVG